MGLFDKIFKKDPRKELEKAESLLAKGQEEKALDIATRLVDGDDQKLANRAKTLVNTARKALVTDYLERANFCEKNNQPGPAAEWCETALAHVKDNAQREALKERIQALHQQAGQAATQPDPDAPQRKRPVEPDEGHEAAGDVDFETHFYTLTGMLRPEYAEQYESHSPAFHQAYVMVNEGRAEEALPIFNELAEKRAEDAIVHLERGRARLLTGDAAGAREDFDKLWGVFGNDYLDLAESMALPLFWADALLHLEEPGPIVEKGDLYQGADPGYTLRLADALVLMKRGGEAADALFESARRFPKLAVLPYRLAAVLTANGEWEKAVHVLEDAIAPTCVSGCAAGPKHMDSFRFLADLYIDHNTHLERADELLRLIRQERRGMLTEADLLLHAKYYRLVEDMEALAKVETALRDLADQGPVAEDTAAVLPKIQTVDSTPI